MSPEANDSQAFALECLRDAQNLKRKEDNQIKVGISEAGTSK